MIVNIALAIVLLIAALSGFRKGFIYTIGSLVGLVVATFLSTRWYVGLGNTLGGSKAAEIVAFLVLFAVISGVISWGFGVLTSVFNTVAIVPGMKLLNRLGGLVLGVFESAVFIGMIILIVRNVTGNAFLEDPYLAELCVTAAKMFVPLLPDAVKNAEPFLRV